MYVQMIWSMPKVRAWRKYNLTRLCKYNSINRYKYTVHHLLYMYNVYRKQQTSLHVQHTCTAIIW